jgi:DNA-binding SARP family transcriptional activator/tetratricopeptide (TPR) repeat protein
MWFGMLGPLLVRDGESVLGVPAGRQRVLLAALLVRAGAVVPADALAEVMWDGTPPGGAGTTLRSHVMRLRRVLGPAVGARVVTRYPGYLIEASDGEVDVLRFRSLTREGGAAARAGQWARAWELLTEGLGLWRGEPLADIPSDLLRREQLPGLEELRLQAAEGRMDAGLRLGRHAELVAELQSLTAVDRLRERFHGQLMLALVRCGRQAEALRAYQSVREVLVEELGTEPGAELQELHQRILAADPALAAPTPAAPVGERPAATVPRELPAPVAGFVGRAEELAALTGLLDRPAGQASAVVISAMGGTAGVGKTALAVQWAHRTADRFPDGQLYVNLRGYDPDRPMPVADALAGFLRALGVPGPDIPPEEDERAARYRSLLADKRALVVLDNAGSVEQVRPLLPGNPACVVVVTSRDSLAGLVARHGATRLDLDLLPSAEAVGLLRGLIGGRVEDDPGAAETLAGQCCRLPLALRVAAELAASRPAAPLAELVGELADQQRRLDLLNAGGDPRTAVRAVFSWSYRHLENATARAFRLAGLHPGPGFEVYAFAALTGTGLHQARAVLDALTHAHLIQPTGPDRFGVHDLLRAYARELAAQDGEEQRRAALTRLFDHYLHAAGTAMDTLYPAERQRRPRIPPPSTPIPPVAGPAAARAWLDAERATLVAVTVYAAGRGWPGHATRLAATVFRYLDQGGHYPEAITIHSHSRAAAERTGDRAAEATALNHLAGVHWRQSRYQQAADPLRQALALSQETGDRAGQARALNNLGLMHRNQGRYQEAIGLLRQALAIFDETGDPTGTANTLNNLGVSEERQGRYDLAARHLGQALELFRQIGDRSGESAALSGLGTVGLRQGRYRQAAGHLYRALAMCGETGIRDAEAETLARIGDVCLRQGHPEEATRHLREALALYQELGSPAGEADALNSLGEVLLAAGRPGDARTQHAAALRLAAQTGDKYQQARAQHGLGQASRAVGDSGGARRHWQQALALFAELGAPEAGQVRAQLAAADDDHGEREGSRREESPLVRLIRKLPRAERERPAARRHPPSGTPARARRRSQSGPGRHAGPRRPGR